jgi:hypothetical protein
LGSWLAGRKVKVAKASAQTILVRRLGKPSANSLPTKLFVHDNATYIPIPQARLNHICAHQLAKYPAFLLRDE